jgi:hypothetical protein
VVRRAHMRGRIRAAVDWGWWAGIAMVGYTVRMSLPSAFKGSTDDPALSILSVSYAASRPSAALASLTELTSSFSVRYLVWNGTAAVGMSNNRRTIGGVSTVGMRTGLCPALHGTCDAKRTRTLFDRQPRIQFSRTGPHVLLPTAAPFPYTAATARAQPICVRKSA